MIGNPNAVFGPPSVSANLFLARVPVVGRAQRRRFLVGVADVPAIAIDREAGKEAIGVRQGEVPAQERLGVAPAEQVVVAPERLVQEAAEAVEDAAGDRELFGLRRTVPLASRRDHEAGETRVVRGELQFVRLEPRLIDERSEEALQHVHEEVIVVLGRNGGEIGERSDQENGLVRAVAAAGVVNRRAPRQISPRQFQRRIVDDPSIHGNEAVGRDLVERRVRRDGAVLARRRVYVTEALGVAIERRVGPLNEPGGKPDRERARGQSRLAIDIPFLLAKVHDAERGRPRRCARRQSRRFADREVAIIAVVDHAIGFVRVGSEQPERVGRAPQIGEREPHPQRRVSVTADPLAIAIAAHVEGLGDDLIEHVAAERGLESADAGKVEVGRRQKLVEGNVGDPA